MHRKQYSWSISRLLGETAPLGALKITKKEEHTAPGARLQSLYPQVRIHTKEEAH